MDEACLVFSSRFQKFFKLASDVLKLKLNLVTKGTSGLDALLFSMGALKCLARSPAEYVIELHSKRKNHFFSANHKSVLRPYGLN